MSCLPIPGCAAENTAAPLSDISRINRKGATTNYSYNTEEEVHTHFLLSKPPCRCKTKKNGWNLFLLIWIPRIHLAGIKKKKSHSRYFAETADDAILMPDEGS